MIELQTSLDIDASLATFQTGTYEQRINLLGRAGEDLTELVIWKHADDLRRYDHVIAETRPDVVIETGTKWGGMAVWLTARGVDVITIDIESGPSEHARRWHDHAPDAADKIVGDYSVGWLGCAISWLAGDSVDPAMVARVAELVAGRRVMVSLDSEHAAPHVAAEIAAYGPLVSPGCYLVVEDGIFDLATDPGLKRRGGERILNEGGPLMAITHSLAGNPQWERDEEIEALTPVSYYPAGWWRRVG